MIEVTPKQIKLLVIQPENVDKDGIVKRHDWANEKPYSIESIDCGRDYAKMKSRKKN